MSDCEEYPPAAHLDLPQPYLLFLGDVSDEVFTKTARGIRDWAPERCIGEYACEGNALSLGLQRLTPADAHARGAQAMVIGVASMGGGLEPSWSRYLVEALGAGLHLISGMHHPLARVPGLQEAAEHYGRRLIELRRPPAGLPVGTGRKRSGKRLLTVGTDCAVGKKYTALAIARSLRGRGLDADFRATGQTGILIAGRGIPIDAVVADFLSGAAEVLSPDAPKNHWDVIEGQGALSHPSYAGVSLGLLHGSQPDAIVLCHQAGRVTHHEMGSNFPLPKLSETIEINLMHARRTNPGVRCAGISLNTGHLSEDDAAAAIAAAEAETGLVCADPIRGGERFEALVRTCLEA